MKSEEILEFHYIRLQNTHTTSFRSSSAIIIPFAPLLALNSTRLATECPNFGSFVVNSFYQFNLRQLSRSLNNIHFTAL